jgi:hypothetical protein
MIQPLINPFTHSHIHFFMQNEPNFKTSRIEYQESCIENMQNEPNFTHNVEAKRRSAAGGPIHSSTHSPIHQKMQNEPNLNWREKNYAKRTQFQNFKNRVSRIVHREYAKRTQFQNQNIYARNGSRATSHDLCKTNPIPTPLVQLVACFVLPYISISAQINM